MDSLDVLGARLAGVNLIEASAGTGKTWTICGLYLRLLLERHLTVQQILVVTFTNAATAELRERIRTRITELLAFLTVGSAADPFGTALCGRLMDRGIGTQELVDRLDLALHSFDEASIFTIHGFCQRALADHPFAAGFPLRIALVESDQDLLMEAVHDFWRRHVAHDSVTPEFARHIQAVRDTPARYAALLARHRAKPLAHTAWPPDLDEPLLDATQVLEPYRDARALWRGARKEITDLLGASLGSLNGTTYKPAALSEAAAQWDVIARDDDPLAPIGDKARLLRESVLVQRTKKNGVTPVHPFFATAERYLALRERLDESLWRARLRLLKRLFDEGSVALQALKRSRQVVSFDDLLSNLRERLRDPQYPWMAQSIRNRFPAALIDEFQDTDPLQLDIFQSIYAGDEAVVFLVGDPKQAIYSFRHADLYSYLRATRWSAKQWSLLDNQRSSEPLLAGLNRLFRCNPGVFAIPEVVYRPVGYGAKPRPRFIDRTEPRAALQIWRLPDGDGAGLHKPLAKRAALAATAAEIARLIQAGLEGRITFDGRSLEPRDIAVLVRSRSLGSEVKRELAALRVGAVELSRDSIFSSAVALDWEVVLTAIATPTRDGLLRVALATELCGFDAADIERSVASETLWSSHVAQFIGYRDLWLNRGFSVMVRQFFTDQAVAPRLLGRPDGERRLTNCLHLVELLQHAAQAHATPESLLRYFHSVRHDPATPDAAQLRLESDQNLVQIVTIHACKGLEYPVVFCPFLCDGGSGGGGPTLEGLEYHGNDLEPVIDFRSRSTDDPRMAAVHAAIQVEQAAEAVRILYVALTRAVHRCYLVEGPYTSRTQEESARSMLNWLVAGQGRSLTDWFEATLSRGELDAAWQALREAGPEAVSIDPLPRSAALSLASVSTDGAGLSTQTPPLQLASGWRLSSYSSLSFGAKAESAASDHDARAELPALPPLAADDAYDEDILQFPRGAAAGECIHAVFEGIDFAERSGWQRSVLDALMRHPQSGSRAARSPSTLATMLLGMVENVTSAELRPGLRLAAVRPDRRLTEWEFAFPAQRLEANRLNAALREWGYSSPLLTFGALEGYLRGFVDLVFEHETQFFILDWKSNHLGLRAADYGPVPLARAMADHGYHLQYLLYTLALDRYLRLRKADYRYESHFGGVFYLFVRGIRPRWIDRGAAAPGVFFHRPAPAVLRGLNDLLGPVSERAE